MSKCFYKIVSCTVVVPLNNSFLHLKKLHSIRALCNLDCPNGLLALIFKTISTSICFWTWMKKGSIEKLVNFEINLEHILTDKRKITELIISWPNVFEIVFSSQELETEKSVMSNNNYVFKAQASAPLSSSFSFCKSSKTLKMS